MSRMSCEVGTLRGSDIGTVYSTKMLRKCKLTYGKLDQSHLCLPRVDGRDLGDF